MTIVEKIAADKASAQRVVVEGFSKAFRSNQLNNLQDGDIITIPEKYEVFSRKIGDNTAEYINVEVVSADSTKHVAEFYPTAMARIAFVVDENGKNKYVDGHREIKRSTGDVVSFIEGKAINPTMEALKGCSIKYNVVERVNTRKFGVEDEDATAEDIQTTVIGSWNFHGRKRPAGYQK